MEASTGDQRRVPTVWAAVVEGSSPITLEDPAAVAGKQLPVVEDGPTVTHGGMGFGAGYLAAKTAGAAEYIDPRSNAAGSLAETFARFSHLEQVLPAMGYSSIQVAELETTINATECDIVVAGTPIDLSRIVKVNKSLVRARYSLGTEAAAELDKLIAAKLGFGGGLAQSIDGDKVKKHQ